MCDTMIDSAQPWPEDTATIESVISMDTMALSIASKDTDGKCSTKRSAMILHVIRSALATSKTGLAL